MICQVFHWDSESKLATAIPASIPHNYDYNDPNAVPPAHTFLVYSFKELNPGQSYSFKPKNFMVNHEFVKGELDYNNGDSLENSRNYKIN